MSAEKLVGGLPSITVGVLIRNPDCEGGEHVHDFTTFLKSACICGQRIPLHSSQTRMEFAGFFGEYFRLATPISRSRLGRQLFA